MTTRIPMIDALHGRPIDPPPVWLMRQAGRYLPEYRALRSRFPGFLDFCRTPQAAAEATLQPVRRFGVDAAIIFSDILVVPDALGRAVTFTEREGPSLTPITDAGGVDALTLDDRGLACLEPVYEALRLVRRDLPDQTALIGFIGAPWTLACYMTRDPGDRDFFSTRVRAHRDPALFDRLIAVLTETTTRHLVGQIDAGADVVQIFDSWAGAAPEAWFRRWVIEPTRDIVAAVHTARPCVPIIGFPRGAGAMIGDYARITGVDAVGLDTQSPLTVLTDELKVPIQGNLDPALLVAGGEGLRVGVEAIRRAFRGRPAVFNLGHGVVPETPPEHVAELIRLVREPLDAGRAS